MKKLIVLTMAALLLAPLAYAGNGKNNTGCGLGTMLFGATEADDSILLQSLAVTTNGTLGNQTFGITSGTSECEKPASFAFNDRAKDFVRDNMDTLASDISRGSGETVTALAELLKIEEAKRDEFYGKLQARFDTIYPAADVSYAHVVDSISEIING